MNLFQKQSFQLICLRNWQTEKHRDVVDIWVAAQRRLRLVSKSPVQEIESTPGPWYSTIAPVPPFTVRMSATFRITSLADVHPLSFPLNFTPITCQYTHTHMYPSHSTCDQTKPLIRYARWLASPTYANFYDKWLRGVEVALAGGQILPFPIGFRRRTNNTFALPCECVMWEGSYTQLFIISRPLRYCCVTNSTISRILPNFRQIALDFATLNVGNICHHIYSREALYVYCIKSRDLVKTNARQALQWNNRQFATK